MKYRAKVKDYQLNLKVTVGLFKQVDIEEMSRFERTFLKGFFKPFVIKKRSVEMIAPAGIPLSERLKNPINKRDFLMIIQQIVTSVSKIKSSGMNLQNVVYDINNIFINENTKELQFIYIASDDNQVYDVFKLFESVAKNTVPEAGADTAFPIRFMNYLLNLIPFNPLQVEEFVMREDASVVYAIKKQTAQSGFMTNKKRDYYEHYSNNQNGKFEDNPSISREASAVNAQSSMNYANNSQSGIGAAYGNLSQNQQASSRPRTYLDEINPDRNPAPSPSYASNQTVADETSLLVDDTADETALLVEDEPVRYATVTRLKTDEVISLTKPVFRIGKERTYADYCIDDNPVISRNHAEIVNRNGNYFLVDLNSKNHTYINGNKIQPNNETEIFSGDRITLANEEFEFQI